jgi:DNA-binding CsgD family transcriptional regulator
LPELRTIRKALPDCEAWDGTRVERSDLEKVAILSRALAVAVDGDRLAELLGSCAELVEADRCVVVRICEHDVHPRKCDVINHSYPDEWIDIYERLGLGNLDPVFQSHLRRSGQQVWSETYARRPPCRKFMGMAADFGLVDGLTNGLVDPSSSRSSLASFAGKRPFLRRQQLLAEILMAPLHMAVMRLVSGCGLPPSSRLSERELEILRWAAKGKTSWEISRIHAVSERTVKFHLGNIFRKLGVTNRAQAIGAALRAGILDNF